MDDFVDDDVIAQVSGQLTLHSVRLPRQAPLRH